MRKRLPQRPVPRRPQRPAPRRLSQQFRIAQHIIYRREPQRPPVTHFFGVDHFSPIAKQTPTQITTRVFPVPASEFAAIIQACKHSVATK
jgi:hypothetical protein